MSRRHHKPEVAEIVEVLAIIPQTSRHGLRIATVRQNGIESAELRTVNLDPAWGPSPADHRTTIRSTALRRVVAALQAAEAKLGEGK